MNKFVQLSSNLSVIEIAINLVIGLCVYALFSAILINFSNGFEHRKVKIQKKSIIETGTMTLFFFAFYILIKLRIGELIINSFYIRLIFIIIGLLIIVFGCIFNIIGRLNLGNNWGNQIKIYEDHSLVQKGVYCIVRHPLYASIIWMFYGASMVFLNWSSFLANTVIFIPFMYYRAKQEEEILTKQFLDYKKYINNVGMFFPKIKRWDNNERM